jgi:hypothetical protein
VEKTTKQAALWSVLLIKYYSADEIRRLRWAGHVAHMRERKVAYRVLVGKPEGRRPLEKPRHRWEDNIKMDLREVGWEGMDSISLAQHKDS